VPSGSAAESGVALRPCHSSALAEYTHPPPCGLCIGRCRGCSCDQPIALAPLHLGAAQLRLPQPRCARPLVAGRAAEPFDTTQNIKQQRRFLTAALLHRWSHSPHSALLLVSVSDGGLHDRVVVRCACLLGACTVHHRELVQATLTVPQVCSVQRAQHGAQFRLVRCKLRSRIVCVALRAVSFCWLVGTGACVRRVGLALRSSPQGSSVRSGGTAEGIGDSGLSCFVVAWHAIRFG
jgi:hypothetical protein